MYTGLFHEVQIEALCVWVWVEVVFSDQANTVRDSLRVGSESGIILAIKNESYIHHEKDM
jgi:hypothetical protein